MKKYVKNSTDNETWSVSDWLGWFDFGYEWSDEPNSEGEIGWAFVDFQGVYLGDIADERYDDPRDMIGRIANGSVYWIDYIDQDLEEYGYEGDESLADEYQWASENLQEENPWMIELIYYALHPEELTVDIEKKK